MAGKSADTKKKALSATKSKAGTAKKNADESAVQNSAKGKKSENSNTDHAALPMFYNLIAVLNSALHGDLRLQPAKSLEFAKGANSIILAASEFAEAAMHYPIVFGHGQEHLNAFAVTGHTNGENLFVDEKGSWRADTYIPAYVRRYPFMLLESPDKKTYSLGVDTGSEMLSTKSGDALYEEGKPTKIAQRALDFCVSYQREIKNSETLFEQIAASGILVERNANVSLPDEKNVTITGFSTVDEKALVALDDEIFLQLRKSGALNLIYCQMWSMRVWKNLLA